MVLSVFSVIEDVDILVMDRVIWLGFCVFDIIVFI